MTPILKLGAPGVCLLILAVSHAHAQPAFEAASIKVHPAAPGPSTSWMRVGPAGITYTNVNLKGCIRAAFNVKSYQMSGGPGWLESERFDVVAKAASPAPKEQLMLMLRRLLEERCRLKTHRETRDVPVYGLVVARNGSRLQAGKEDSQTEIGGSHHAIDSRGMSMKQLADVLSLYSGILDRPVLDTTGLTGVYDITLDFESDTEADIMAALRNLGLKLEAQKRPMEFLVIDQFERPSEN